MSESIIEVGGLKFYVREGTSDEKSIREVVEKKVYQRKDFQFAPEEHWIDAGAYIGAFSVLAASKGCQVTAFEPDPLSFEQLKKNIELNKLEDKVEAFNVAVSFEGGHASLSRHNKGNFWRNSICRKLKGETIQVPLINLLATLEEGFINYCIKLDIEGSEMGILEEISSKQLDRVNKIVVEWTFDYDDRIKRPTDVVEKMKKTFPMVKSKKMPDQEHYTWFPPNAFIFCSKTPVINQ